MRIDEHERRRRIRECESILHKSHIPFERKNCGYHLVIRQGRKTVDYWPTSYKYRYHDSPNIIRQGPVSEAINIIYRDQQPEIPEFTENLLYVDLETTSRENLIAIIYQLVTVLNKKTA